MDSVKELCTVMGWLSGSVVVISKSLLIEQAFLLGFIADNAFNHVDERQMVALAACLYF